MNDGAVLIGFIITIVIVGVAGGTTLIVFICIKWRDYVKRRHIMRSVLPSRQPTRRRRRVRVQQATNQLHTENMDLPPPYSESDYFDHPPPPYTINPLLFNADISRGNSRRNSRLTTPQSRGRNNSVLRHSSFSVHLNSEGNQPPCITPIGSMHNSQPASIPSQTNSEITTHQNSSNDVT